jgi:hypothetical protein
VRRGAEKARIRLNLGDYIVSRDILPDGTHTLKIEGADGIRRQHPQEILDGIMGELSFDPMEFIDMKPKAQVEQLRKVAKIDLDVDRLNLENKADYEERTQVKKEVADFKTRISNIVVQEGLPKAKIDTEAIMQRIADIDVVNEKARELDEAKRVAALEVERLERLSAEAQMEAVSLKAQIAKLQSKMKEAAQSHTELSKQAKGARKLLEAMPSGEYAQATQLSEELQQAQVINREIDRHNQRDALQGQLNARLSRVAELTRQMEEREETKRSAVAGASMPMAGLTFDDDGVLYNGIPVAQLGDAEKIRVSTAIAMAANPKLRVIRIMHGEALDDAGLQLLAQMAEEHDYQIWMARVDTSGKVGIIMEDGMVKEQVDDVRPEKTPVGA